MDKLIQSFNYASEGIVYSISTERNMRIHLFVAAIVLLLGMAFHLSGIDLVILLVAIGLVIGAELINTSIEKVIDLVQSEYHPLAKAAKDVAAGAVLLMSFIAVLLGILVFLPYFKLIAAEGWSVPKTHSPSFFILEGFFIILITYAVKAYWYLRNKQYSPNSLVGIILFILVLFSTCIFWVSYFIIIILIFLIVLRRYVTLLGVIQNIAISIIGFYLLYWLFY